MKPLLLGESNPYGEDPEYALFPHPRRSAGGRLCYDIFSLDRGQYLRLFDRANVCQGPWRQKQAFDEAARLMLKHRVIVALGAKVASAIGVPFTPFYVKPVGDAHFIAVLPHPSGRCRLWNDKESYRKALWVRDHVLNLCGGSE